MFGKSSKKVHRELVIAIRKVGTKLMVFDGFREKPYIFSQTSKDPKNWSTEKMLKECEMIEVLQLSKSTLSKESQR
jgi:hypothetical protein